MLCTILGSSGTVTKLPSIYVNTVLVLKSRAKPSFDPFLRVMDVQQENGEFREAIVGMTTNWKLLYVVYSIREDDIFRIISARRTTKSERRFYEDY